MNGLDYAAVEDEYEEMTMKEIMTGKVTTHIAFFLIRRWTDFQDINFPGLLPLVEAYLDTLDMESLQLQKIRHYLDFIRRRSEGWVLPFSWFFSFAKQCTGSLMTPATWIRDFIRSHPDYERDSVVSQSINYDLLKAVDDM